MTGYLQRLVSSALHAGGSIHPAVGSMFSVPQLGAMADILEVNEDVFAPSDSAPRGRESAEQSHGSPEPHPRAGTPIPSTSSSLLPPTPHNRPRYATTLAAMNHASAARPGPRTVQPAFRSNARLGHQDLRDSNSVAPTLFDALEGAPDDRLVPNAGGQMPHEGVEETQALVPQHAVSPLTTRITHRPDAEQGQDVRAHFTQASTQAPLEPDEIHIHIGRIEVTAVQPAPARPAPTAPRPRTPSLSEYLRRRDGRPS